jgi:hypothetical protein
MPTLAQLIDTYEHPGRMLGAFCRNGHERAVHERKYARAGVLHPTRVCLACQQERRLLARTDRRSPSWRQDGHPDDLLWERFCREIVDRIEAVRQEEVG